MQSASPKSSCDVAQASGPCSIASQHCLFSARNPAMNRLSARSAFVEVLCTPLSKGHRYGNHASKAGHVIGGM